ncbi:neurturin isoform X2 [Dicentrarchus labrax]|uniref:neurturin isoform X2 n=1 Tax=Dicentrarchus labrax TaxID=13489 RepID=UPI0021F6989A|nr:neurturin isoform X2 [Dicentrarchus labrax]
MLFPCNNTSFNAPPRSKMKLWKGATFAFLLCGAALSILLIRNMATIGQFRPKTKYPYASSSSLMQSSSSESTSKTSPQSPSSSPSSSAESTVLSRQMGLHRRTRSADEMNSLLSEFSMMFQSFTEGELQHVVGTLLDRKRRKSRRLGEKQARRTKRAQRPKPCSLRKLQLTVSELGLGYDSNETVLLRYCSGKCEDQHRQNYDVIMKYMMRTGFRKKGRKDKVSNGPCCRPTSFEKDFSFLGNNNRYYTVQNVSAKNCGCV